MLGGPPSQSSAAEWRARRTHLISDSTTSFTSVGGLIFRFFVHRLNARYKRCSRTMDKGTVASMRPCGDVESGLRRRVRPRARYQCPFSPHRSTYIGRLSQQHPTVLVVLTLIAPIPMLLFRLKPVGLR